ncbi:hypothetical protein [Hydrogenophaga sp. BPS33]|uniref:hypothetical protein n=1 Tax=Hydrogenophaga sp. BPS33 TaxID=2651974 RepID=UPI0013573999|nr:hypothetical protein [Hydrogenophaga sp. BPS33]
MPFIPSTSRPLRKGRIPTPLSHLERQRQQQSRMVREQPDDTPRDQRAPGIPLGERQMG